MTCLCILAPENLVSMITNKSTFLFYTLLLKLKLVCYFLSNRHKIFTQLQATLIVLLKKSGFQFSISTSDVKMCEIKLSVFVDAHNPRALSPQSSTPEVDIQNRKPLFFSKTIKVVKKNSCLLDKKWPTSFNLSKRV